MRTSWFGVAFESEDLRDALGLSIQVGLLGIGTVGLGTWTVLRRNEEEITRRAGRPIRITWIGTRTLDRARSGTRGATEAIKTLTPMGYVGAVEDVAALAPTHIIISPGPCTPTEAGISTGLVRRFGAVPSAFMM